MCGMKYSYSLHIIGVAGTLALLAGCTAPNSEQGVLGNTRFTYQCVADTDPYCTESLGGLPDIALGSRFSFQSERGRRVLSASDGIIQDPETGYLAAVSEGWSTVMSKSGAVPSTIDDLVYVRVGVPVRVRIFFDRHYLFGDSYGEVPTDEDGTNGGIKISSGRTEFRAFLVDKDDQMLAGALPVKWTIADPVILQFDESAHPTTNNVVELKSRSIGSTRVTVRIGTLEASFSVEVTS